MKPRSPLKAFRINEYDVYAGQDLQDAILACMADTGLTQEEAYDDMYGNEVSLDTKVRLDTEDEQYATVAELLAEMEGPGMLFSYGE